MNAAQEEQALNHISTGHDSSAPILVIDTSFGSTVGIVGQETIAERDSRSHVEHLEVNINQAVERAGLTLGNISTIVVGTGPAPFTGLRAGIVTAKALAFVTGASLVGQNVLEAEALWMAAQGLPASADTASDADSSDSPLQESNGADNGDAATHLVLAVNDARRKQLYWALYQVDPVSAQRSQAGKLLNTVNTVNTVMPMDIDYPDNIVDRVNTYIDDVAHEAGGDITVDVMGHGVERYADILQGIARLRTMHDGSLLEAGAQGVRTFAELALAHSAHGDDVEANPLYVRRPDVQVPNPLKRVVNAS
ncbi:tRNA (adenosine(37)-N6)-threonylcarbamoyltransferase complex dimerization subunit type 1 TsaB [Bifidobacterium aquikefiricola]|uniref:tRNA (Adenosine(37)-N6)-threonylcarbamoyltransferase complex dimerization subunit type 1 TsaB n=1 Tax=Bifidobacterium aquikefiricola TaxID=3059038 RepID=A0AB39U4X4_9BIFI